MPTYRYQPGDRPLDGFTLRAPAGRGGFGEVYFAESDAGREVALKALFVTQGYDEIELRGIRHCMNLKSPHLVSIFDVKTGSDGTPFVVMEYVAGPSLRDLLNDSPQGLGPDKAAFFLREVAKGLSHLHGYGVVHRDLKPANIFYEDGYVKIGDYGLSKLMSADPVASQTVSVGTVHYMAPEIGAGRYDKSIDLYALGCLLYEMLTGKVPYRGASPSEVLMKHLQAEPELDDVPAPFARVIRKALQKNPDDRYATAAEMVEDLFGAEHVRDSVSQLNANELSSIAQRVGRKVASHDRLDPSPPQTGHAAPAAAPRHSVPPEPAAAASPPRSTLSRWPDTPGKWTALLGVAVAGLVAFMTLGASNGQAILPFTYVLAVGLAGAATLSKVRFHPTAEPTLKARLIQKMLPAAAAGGAAAGIASIYNTRGTPDAFTNECVVGGIVWAVLMLFVEWQAFTRADRERPFSLALWLVLPVLAAFAGVWIAPEMSLYLAGIALITAVGAQIMSPPAKTAPRSEAPAAPRPTAALTPGPNATPRPAALHAPLPAHHHAAADADTNADSVDGPDDDTSRHSRLAALLLCASYCILPLGGLHRFYAGRWLTGILWLCTFGFIGIGQLIDGILIAAGAFTDARGKPVLRWTLAPAPNRHASGVGRTWTPRIAGQISPLNMLLHLAGVLLMLVSLALILPTYLSLFQAVNTLPLFDSFREAVAKDVGYTEWPLLASRVTVLLGLAGVTGATLLVAAARRGSVAHCLRGVAAGLLCALLGLMAAIDQGTTVVREASLTVMRIDLLETTAPHSAGATLDLYLQRATPGLIMGLTVLGLATVLLLIPAKAPPHALATAPETHP